MDTDTVVNDVIIKKEPPESLSPLQDEDSNNNSNNDNSTTSQTQCGNGHDSSASDTDSKTSPHGSLRYVSRRGRPPGGGYSIKPHSHYVTFGSSPLMTSQEFGRQSSLGQSSSSLSPHDIMKGSLGSGLDALDTRRFGFHSFDSEKNSFRCEGCDVVFSSRDTYAMHMLLRAKNESCVALPTSAISSNPENPTPREKFEREIREKAMLVALRSQAAIMSKAAAAAATVVPKNADNLSSLRRTPNSNKDDLSLFGASASDVASSLSSILAFDSYGLYMDHRQYRRLLSEYGLRSTTTGSSLSAMMEQLSCSVCGEIFSNKDALAMHMMFHTRDVDNESKPTMSWRADPGMHSNHNFAFSDLESVGRSTDNTSQGRRQENPKSTGDRQLTAERIAELKRMAIESSLRSSLKKHSINQDKNLLTPRPKSVSEDMVVTSSAQPRPLSADDIVKISNSSDKSIYKPHKTTSRWEMNSNYNDQEYPRVNTRKRNISVSEENSYDNLPYFTGAYSMRKHFRYENTSLSAFAKSSQYLKSVFNPNNNREKSSKVCDNHVSSASGPQDSDETSDGSSSAVDQGQEDNNANRKVGPEEESSPSLDTIMSSDTILVPVENLEDIQDNDKNSRGRIDSDNTGQNNSEITAIDFSVGKRDRSDDDETRFSRTDCHQDRYHNNSTPFRYGSSDTEDDTNRQLYINQRHVELIPDGQTDETRPMPTPSHSSLKSGDANGNSNDSLTETSSRVGEARYCPHCEILFLDVTLFHLHMGLHNVNNPWQCNTCGLVCGGRLEFNTHVLHY